MGEIKFRGLNSDGNWFIGNYLKTGTGMHYIVPKNVIGSLPQYSVRAETVGKYTGLKDKSSHEIYEGDIVVYTRIVYTDCSQTEIEDIQEPITGEVYYAEGLWLGIKFIDGTGKLFLPGQVSSEEDNPGIEIIGNIYEKQN